MEKVTFSQFLTLSLLGIRRDGEVSKVVYHLELNGPNLYHDEAEMADVVAKFCGKFNVTAEVIGDVAFILRENLPVTVMNPRSLLKARARSINGIYIMVQTDRVRREEFDDESESECKSYQSAYAETVAFGKTFGGSKLDPSHTRKCQKCRFWKAEHDRKIAKVDSRPGTMIDEVC